MSPFRVNYGQDPRMGFGGEERGSMKQQESLWKK